ncbi:MAG: hypothetical protein ACLFUT_09185 [Desulfobacteraceae bacterium]
MDSPHIIKSLLKMGERLERANAQFYQQAAKRVTDEQARQEFKKLAAVELDHESFFSDLKGKHENEMDKSFKGHDPEALSRYAKAIQDYRVFDFMLKHTVSGHESASDVIELAIRFEKDTILLYAGLASLVEDRTLGRLLKEIIREEFDHLSQLTHISFM